MTQTAEHPSTTVPKRPPNTPLIIIGTLLVLAVLVYFTPFLR